MTQTRPFNVLFLCTGNSARSILAEAILNHVGRTHFCAFSAGSQPRDRINPYALDLLIEMGHDVSRLRAKSWNEFTAPGAPRLKFVITVCDNAAGEICPSWPGQPLTAHWGLPDPAAVTGTQVEIAQAFAETYHQLDNRIGQFVSMSLAGLDRHALQKKLAAMGTRH